MIRSLFLYVVEISLQISLIIFILIVLGSLLNQRYAAKWKYFIWIILAVRLVLPFSVNLPFHPIVLHVPAEITTPIAANMETGIPILLPPEQNGKAITAFDIAAALWLFGCLLFLTIHIFSYLHYKRQLIQRGIPAKDDCILYQLPLVLKELQIDPSISVIKHSKAGSPMIIGFFHPILVLPEIEYSQEEVYFILKHELVHLKRHDICVKFLFIIANAIHWFNPMIYLMQKEAVVDMELSCDEKVVLGSSHTARKAYTETLYSTLHRQHKKAAALTTQFYGGTAIMKKRFRNILCRTQKKNGFPILTCAIALTVFLGAMTGCSLTAPPVSDTENTIPADASAEATRTVADTQNVPGTDSETETDNRAEETLSADGQEIKNIAENFAAAYFSGDIDAVKSYLTSPYEWDIDIYAGTGALSDFMLKGLDDIGSKGIGSVQAVSLEYKNSDNQDMFLYLTLEFVKQEDGWKIQFYGVE